jgi:hypothetical protein
MLLHPGCAFMRAGSTLSFARRARTDNSVCVVVGYRASGNRTRFAPPPLSSNEGTNTIVGGFEGDSCKGVGLRVRTVARNGEAASHSNGRHCISADVALVAQRLH